MSKNPFTPKAELTPAIRGLVSGLIAFIAIGFCVILLSLSATSVLDENYRSKLSFFVEYGASLIDAEQHLLLEQTRDEQLYQSLLEPLVTLHQSIPEATYLYTMIEQQGQLYIILDTANSPVINNDGTLEPSELMELYESDDVSATWIPTLKAGKTYIDEDYFTDEFGTFISASAPIFDHNGNFIGFLGIDINADDYKTRESNISQLLRLTLTLGFLIACMVGYAVAKDQNNIRRLTDETKRLSLTDPLTGAYNRRFLKLIADREWQHYKRYHDSLAVITLDIDFFKDVNDQHGHDAGDECLVQLVSTLTDSLRTDDYLVRMGGEEFAILLPGTGLHTAAIVAERLRIKIAELQIAFENTYLKITVSGGVAAAIDEDSKILDVMKRSDRALYLAKEKGRNTVIVHDTKADAAQTDTTTAE